MQKDAVSCCFSQLRPLPTVVLPVLSDSALWCGLERWTEVSDLWSQPLFVSPTSLFDDQHLTQKLQATEAPQNVCRVFNTSMFRRYHKNNSKQYIQHTSRAGQAGGGSFQKEKNYIAKKEFAYRMCARRPTSAMPKPFLCFCCPSAVTWWWCDLFWCHEVVCGARWSNVVGCQVPWWVLLVSCDVSCHVMSFDAMWLLVSCHVTWCNAGSWWWNVVCCALQSTTPVLQRSTPVLLRSTKCYYVILCTTKYYSSTTLYYKVLPQYYSVLQSTTPVLLCTTKYYSSTTQYYSVLHSTTLVLQSTTPVLLCTTKYNSSTTLLCTTKVQLPYYSVLQSATPGLQCTTPELLCTTKYYSSTSL